MIAWLYLKLILHKVIGPMLNLIFEEYPYTPFLLLVFTFIIVALIQRRKKQAKQNQKKQPQKKQAPAGAYTNFKGEVWYPDGRKWNEDKQRWEGSDYADSPTPEDE